MKNILLAVAMIAGLSSSAFAQPACTAQTWVDRGFDYIDDIYDAIDALADAGCPEYLGIYQDEIWDLHSDLLDLDQDIANGNCPEQDAVDAMNAAYGFLQLLNGSPCPIPAGFPPGITRVDHPTPFVQLATFKTEQTEEAEDCGCSGSIEDLPPEVRAKYEALRKRIELRRKAIEARRLGTPTLAPTPAPALVEPQPVRYSFTIEFTLGVN